MFDGEQKFSPQPSPNAWHPPGPAQISTPGGTAAEKINAPPAGVQRELVPVAGAPAYPPIQPPQEKKRTAKEKRSSPGKGLVAAMLILSLMGGMLGGAAAIWHLGNAAMPQRTIIIREPTYVAAPTMMPLEALGAAASSFDVTYAVEKAAASVVEIEVNTTVRTMFGAREAQGAGSGVIINGDGYIVTNYHVVGDSEEITVRTYSGEEYTARLIGIDPQTDLAVIKIDADGLVPAEFVDPDSVRVGQIAVAIGNPLGTLGGTVTHGVVSAMDRQITIDGQEMTLMQTSAAVNPGNSGGGLFNASGELIGVVNAKGSGMDIEGLGFAIPSDIVQRVTRDLISRGFVTGRPELGIRVVQIDDARAASHHGMSGIGVFVLEVTRDNGLMPGDRIVYIGEVEIQTAEQVSHEIRARTAGDVIEIIIERDGETLTIEATLGEYIPAAVRANLPEPSEL